MFTKEITVTAALVTLARLTALATLAILPALAASSLPWGSAFAAGGDIGNGGDGVVCRNADGSIRSVEALDIYEAREVYGWKVDLGGPETGPDAKLWKIIERVRSKMPELALWMEQGLHEFRSDNVWLRGKELTDIPDSGHLYFPAGCKVEQVIIQAKHKVYPGQALFTINRDLFMQMDDDSQAAIQAHELFYRIAIQAGHKDSIATRRLNAIFLSDRYREWSLESIAEDILALFSPEARWEDYRYPSNTVRIRDPKHKDTVNTLLYSVRGEGIPTFVSRPKTWFSRNTQVSPNDQTLLKSGTCKKSECWIQVNSQEPRNIAALWIKPGDGIISWVRPKYHCSDLECTTSPTPIPASQPLRLETPETIRIARHQ